jgi:catalase
MPLPSDEQLIKTAENVLGLFKGVFGPHAGYRPAHAKGQVLNGTFTPSAAAKSLSKAPQFNAASTPITVRFSNSTGIPQIPDTDGNANPRGIALRFNLPSADGKRKHTDIVGHSTPCFPARTGAEFGEFLSAVKESTPGLASPTPVEKFLGSHPAALAFVTAPKPFPVSFSTQPYYALNAFKFINAEGKETWIRYTFLPEAGTQVLDDKAVEGKGPNYLFDELAERVKSNPIGFKLVAQIGEEGDVTDDINHHWPDSRKVVELGSFKLNSLDEDSVKNQKYLIFDPIPRVEGIEPSADPILEFRAALYLISGRERRAV